MSKMAVQNLASPKKVQKMGQKVPGPKIHNNIFLLAKGPVPYDQKIFLVYYTNMTKMRH